MWDRFSFDDDGSRLLHALLNDSLINVHDVPFYASAYLPCLLVCFVRYCSSTDKRAIGSFAEESENAYLSSRASGGDGW
jgi:hypothetical protein